MTKLYPNDPQSTSCTIDNRWSKQANEKRRQKLLGRIFSESTKKLISISATGENNSQWKGDNVKNDALHAYVKRHKPKPKSCENCHKEHKKLDLANISQEYLRDLDDWEYLCRRCHMTKDGRMKNLKQYSTPLKTHCKRGHPFSGDNLYVYPNGKGRGCITCIRMLKRRYLDMKKQKRLNNG